MRYDSYHFDSTGLRALRWGQPISVFEFQRGVLYLDGRFVRVLNPGRHRFWGSGFQVRLVDVRPAIRILQAQEILTADHAPIRATFTAQVRTVDPRAFAESAQDAAADEYVVLQLAARDAFQLWTAEQLLANRAGLQKALEDSVGERLSPYGRALDWFQVRDLMLPGDFRRAFGAVVLARQEGLAALERARGETAALRNLANAAQLFKDHPSLLALRAIQALESGENRTLVLSPEILRPS